jgi:hypothetical protein
MGLIDEDLGFHLVAKLAGCDSFALLESHIDTVALYKRCFFTIKKDTHTT